MKKINKLSTILALAALFTGCTNTLSNNDAQNAAKPVCLVSGKILLAGNAPATENASRSASSSFTQTLYITDYSPESITIEATHSESGVTVAGTITQNDDGTLSYTLPLTATGTWRNRTHIWSHIDDAANQSISILDNFSSQIDIIVEPGQPTLNQDIYVYPCFADNTSGSISLSVGYKTAAFQYAQEDLPTEVEWHWLPAEVTSSYEYVTSWFTEMNAGNKDVTKDFAADENTVQFDFEKVPAGSYDIQLTFNGTDNDGNPRVLYTCTEAVTVYSGFVTDKWINSQEADTGIQLQKHFTTDAEGNTIFQITEELICHYTPSPVTFNITATNTPYILWNKATKTYTGLDQYDNYITDSQSYLRGTALFNSISGGESVDYANQLFDSPDVILTSSYCYTPDYEEKIIRRMKTSYAGLTVDESFNLELEALFEPFITDTNNQGFFVKSAAYSNDALYISWFWNNSSYQHQYCFTRYDLTTKELLNATTDAAYTRLIVNESNGSGTIVGIYTDTNSSTSYLEKNTFTIATSATGNNTKTLALGSTKLTYTLDADTLGDFYTYDSTVEVTDIQIVGNYLYALVAANSNKKITRMYKEVITDTGEKDSDGNPITETSYAKDIGLFASTGGVLKFDISSTATTLTPATWKDNTTKLLGWYTIGNTETQNGTAVAKKLFTASYNAMTGNTTYTERTSATKLSSCPPESASDSYFYGPVRFIAIKPDELVIADDGAYEEINDDDSVNSINEKNRVVTINLTTESFSATDVNVTFTKTMSGSPTGGIEDAN